MPQAEHDGHPDRAGGANWAGFGGTLGMVPLRVGGGGGGGGAGVGPHDSQGSAARSIEEHKRSSRNEQEARAYVTMRSEAIMLAQKFKDLCLSTDASALRSKCRACKPRKKHLL